MDSLEKALYQEPSRFLKYLNWNKIKSPEDFIKEFRKAFDTNFGKNMLDNMTKKHWDILLNAQETKIHFKTLKKQNDLKEFISEKHLDRGREKYDETTIKNISVKTKEGIVYKKSYQRWTDKQEEFVIQRKAKNQSYEGILGLYNMTFKIARTLQSIINKLRSLK